MSAMKVTNYPIQHSRTKHIDVCHHFIRDHQQKGDICIESVGTDDQLANIFTKPVDEKRFCKLRNELNILDFFFEGHRGGRGSPPEYILIALSQKATMFRNYIF
jgi:hypothetical protein